MITSRIQEGLPFAAKPLIQLIIRSILARGQFLFQVEINHFMMMANHFHMIMRVLDPERVAAFIDYFKTETAHAINRLLGRRKRTVWEDSYDAVPLLTPEDTIRKIVYIYTNPQNANLESTIDAYPSLSSWNMFVDGNTSFETPWIHRNYITRINDFYSEKEELERYNQLRVKASETYTFTLNPDGWMELFGIDSEYEKAEINKRIISDVRAVEKELAQKRRTSGRSVVGALRLRRQPINMSYTPTKFTRRMWCVCSDLELRRRFINFVKGLLREARAITARWKRGDFSEPFPIGLFPPRFPRLANVRPGSLLQL